MDCALPDEKVVVQQINPLRRDRVQLVQLVNAVGFERNGRKKRGKKVQEERHSTDQEAALECKISVFMTYLLSLAATANCLPQNGHCFESLSQIHTIVK